jgi:DNA-binding transcriptional regulator YhcF (GntR family)
VSWDRVKAAIEASAEAPSVPAALVLIHLANRANEDGEAWPSVASLAADTGLPARTIERARAELIAAGYIADTRKRRGATGRVVVFEVLTSNAAKMAVLARDQCPQIVQVMPPNRAGNTATVAAGTSQGIAHDPPNALSRAGGVYLSDLVGNVSEEAKAAGRKAKAAFERDMAALKDAES